MINRQHLLLSLLYLPGNSGTINEPIKGSISLMKQTFLVQDVCKSNTFQFVPYDLGPVSFQVYEELDKLQELGLVQITKFTTYKQNTVEEYNLSPSGIIEARNILDHIIQEDQDKIREIKTKFNKMKMLELLKYVYEHYPQFKKRSVIKLF